MTTPTSPKELAAALRDMLVDGYIDDLLIRTAASYLDTLPTNYDGEGSGRTPLPGRYVAEPSATRRGEPSPASHVLVPREATEGAEPKMIPNPLWCETCQGLGYLVGDSEWEPYAVQCVDCKDRRQKVEASATVEQIRSVLREHWLTRVACDHATGTDTPSCSCSLWKGPTVASVGAAVDAWISHVCDALSAAPAPSLGALPSEGTKTLNDALDYFQQSQKSPGDWWAFAEDGSSYSLDFSAPTGQKFWIDLVRDGSIAILWKPAKDAQPQVAIFRPNPPSRASVIEEAAKVVDREIEEWRRFIEKATLTSNIAARQQVVEVLKDIAAAIRSLADKSHNSGDGG